MNRTNNHFSMLRQSDIEALREKEVNITAEYRNFLASVREAFNRHCDQIKMDTDAKLSVIPEENEEARRQVIASQQVQLNKTLVELKQLLAQREAQTRTELEKIEEMREQGEFDFEEELGEVSEAKVNPSA